MLKRNIFLSLLVFVLATCGSETKKEGAKDKEKAETEEKAASTGGESGQAKAPATPGAKKSLFGGRFAGVLGGLGNRAPGGKLDLAGAFGTSLPNLAPQMAKSVAGLKDTGLTKDLWALTPADAALGIVVGDGTVRKVSGALTELKRILDAQPGGAQLVAKIRTEIAGDSGFDIFDPEAWSKTSGLDLSKGAAFFISPAGQALAVLPVTDPAAFQRAIKDTDNELGADNCVTAGGRYVCAEELAYAKAATAPHDSPLAKRVAGLPGWLRGDIELVAHPRSFPNAAEGLKPFEAALTDIGTLALAARLDNGSLTLRGWMEGKRGGPVGNAFAAIPPAALQELSGGAENWYHLRLPLSFIFANAGDMPESMPLGDDVDLRRDLFDNLTGEIAAYSRGNYFLAEHLVLGLEDPAPTTKALKVVCEGIKQQGLLEQVKQQGAACQGLLDLGALLSDEPTVAPFVQGMPKIELMAAVNGKTLEFRIGRVTPPSGTPGDNASTAVAKELMTGDWNGVQWGVAFDPIAILPPVLTDRLDKMILGQLPPTQLGPLNLMRWVYDHIYDTGVGMALRNDGIYLTAQVTTYAGDPPAAQQAYEAALNLLLKRDYQGYKAAIAELAKKYPGSLAGRNAALQVKGVPMLGQLGAVGVFALVGIAKKAD